MVLTLAKHSRAHCGHVSKFLLLAVPLVEILLNYEPVRIPVGCSVFPKDVLRVSRRWAEKRYPNLVYWNRLDRGGHFAAFEQPDLFVKELRACFGKMRAM
jgi:pimeloyl-ACP methyl ester carboxylesterase